MPQNKKHHYVPRFYLKRFSNDGKSINIWNLPSKRKILSANLKNQCYRSHFYGKEPDVELALGKVEIGAAHIFRVIDQCCALPPHGSLDHQFLVLCVLMQHGRTVYTADVLNEMNDKLMKHLIEPRAKAKGIDLSRVKIGFKEVGRVSLGLAMQNYPILFDLDYKLLINKTNVEFVTSDNPVALYNQLFTFRTYISNTGLATKGLQIFFPINPRYTLLFFDPAVYSVGSRKNSFIDVSLPRDVYEINTLQMCSAAENIYYRDHSFNAEALHRKAAPFRRTRKSNLDIFPREETDNKKRELLASSQEDIRTNLTLSFVNLTKSMKKWRDEFQKMKEQPAAVFRDEKLLDDHREFLKKVKNNEYEPGEFSKFLALKYGRA
jgi:hypothetical protein